MQLDDGSTRLASQALPSELLGELHHLFGRWVRLTCDVVEGRKRWTVAVDACTVRQEQLFDLTPGTPGVDAAGDGEW